MKIIKIVLSVVLMMSVCLFVNTPSYANEYYFDEQIEVIEENIFMLATQSKKAKKTLSYKNSSGKVLWSVSVIGTFSYNGSSSKCTKSDVSLVINDTNWKESSKSGSLSGNKATAKAVVKCVSLGATISTISKTVTLSCSPKGELS